MTESNRALKEVETLAAERRRYQEWIDALEARRESTPAHVFERVMRDYRERLDRVNEQLSSHESALEEERASLASRLALLEGEEQLRRDERAELELRAHVGELTAAEVKAALKKLDETLKELGSERETLTRSMDEIRELLKQKASGGEAGAAAAPATEAESESARAEVAAAAADASATEPAAAPESPESPEPAGAAAAAEPAAPLSDVVRENTNEISLLEDLLDPSATAGVKAAGAEAPLAANVPANTPIVLRPSGPVEQTKTLKCQECGALNYPTEWYCERCGAELAAL